MGNGSSISKEIKIYKAELHDILNNITEVEEFIESSASYSVTEYSTKCKQLVNKCIDNLTSINIYARELYESIIHLRKQLDELLQDMQIHMRKLLGVTTGKIFTNQIQTK